MEIKVKDLTVGELKSLISSTIKESLKDLVEDVVHFLVKSTTLN